MELQLQWGRSQVSHVKRMLLACFPSHKQFSPRDDKFVTWRTTRADEKVEILHFQSVNHIPWWINYKWLVPPSLLLLLLFSFFLVDLSRSVNIHSDHFTAASLVLVHHEFHCNPQSLSIERVSKQNESEIKCKMSQIPVLNHVIRCVQQYCSGGPRPKRPTRSTHQVQWHNIP